MKARTFIDAVGRRTIADALGVGLTAVSNAYVDDRFPASWFDALDRIASEAGEDLPRSAFNWKRAKSLPQKTGKSYA